MSEFVAYLAILSEV